MYSSNVKMITKTENTLVASAFPGCGKSYLYNKSLNKDIKVLDSDSSNFSWIKDEDGNNTKERNPEFPQNYINHIKENIGQCDIIFVSSHKEVRDALKANNIEFVVIYPNDDLCTKMNFMKRYIDRGSDENFINLMKANWSKFITEIENDKGLNKIKLFNSQTISDIITI